MERKETQNLPTGGWAREEGRAAHMRDLFHQKRQSVWKRSWAGEVRAKLVQVREEVVCAGKG